MLAVVDLTLVADFADVSDVGQEPVQAGSGQHLTTAFWSFAGRPPLAHPAAAVVLYVGVMWGWHIPGLYDAALRHPLVHALEHTFFMTAGVLYWWHLMSPIRSRARLTGMGPVLYMLSTKLLVGILGIAITFAPDALYAFYEDQPPIWGLSAADDQALAGAIMALEQSIVMGVALAWLFVRALAESESDEQRAERYA
jgi:cytochrome c oxidase assembly factor CtaG